MHRDGRNFFGLETVVREGERVGSDGQVDEIVDAIRIRLLGPREFCLVTNDRYDGFRQHSAGLVSNCARDSAEGLLSLGTQGKCERHPEGYREYKSDESGSFEH